MICIEHHIFARFKMLLKPAMFCMWIENIVVAYNDVVNVYVLYLYYSDIHITLPS